MPDSPIPLLGRDLLTKLRAYIYLQSDGQAILKLPHPFEARILQDIPGLWAEDNLPGLTTHVPPILIELKSGATPVSLKQYPVPRKALVGIQKYLNKFLHYGILKPCQSPWNTPLLPAQKPETAHCCPVQDLRAVNQAVMTMHPAVTNELLQLLWEAGYKVSRRKVQF